MGVENWKGESFARLAEDNPWRLAKNKNNRGKSRLVVLSMRDTAHFVTIDREKRDKVHGVAVGTPE